MRQAEVCRKTGETDIRVALALDGTGKNSIDPAEKKLQGKLTSKLYGLKLVTAMEVGLGHEMTGRTNS